MDFQRLALAVLAVNYRQRNWDPEVSKSGRASTGGLKNLRDSTGFMVPYGIEFITRKNTAS